MSGEMKTVVGAARNLDGLIGILQSELTAAGFSPKPESDAAGNFLRLKAGFGVSAKVYHRPVGDDVILTWTLTGSRWLWLVCLCGLCPGLIGLLIRDRNVNKVRKRLPTILEAANSSYKAQFPPFAPAYPPPAAPAPTPPTKKYCMDCGAEMPVQGTYCPRCGKRQP